MIPVPEVTELRQMPLEFLPIDLLAGSAPAPASRLPVGTALDMGALLRFKSLMALDAEPVSLARMCYDRLYAYERIAAAHASGRDPLKRLALELFQIYHRREGASALVQ